MRLLDDYIKSLIGERVVARNPVTGDEWRGTAIAYSDQPTIMVAADEGLRVMLPAHWFAPEPHDSGEATK